MPNNKVKGVTQMIELISGKLYLELYKTHLKNDK